MEEPLREVDRADGGTGEGRGWKTGVKLLGFSTKPLASALGRVKALERSWAESIRGSLWKRTVDADDADRHRSNPVDILKRLQREAFFEIMKLRDRQDKVERTLALYKTGKGSPFLEDSTRMKGLVDVAGALLFVGNDGQETADVLKIAGIRTGVDSRFVFETVTRQKDTLMAEFVASQDSLGHQGDVPRSPLALSKVMYSANISNRLSLITIPLGARCRDFGFGSNLLQFQGLTEPSSFGPPLLNQCLGCAAGVRVKCSGITASVAQAVSRLDMQLFSSARRCSDTYGQVDYQLLAGTRVSLLGIWQKPRSSSQPTRVTTSAVPTGASGSYSSSETESENSSPRVARESTTEAAYSSPHVARESTAEAEYSYPRVARESVGNVSSGSLAVMLESEFDDSSRIRGWVELQKYDLKSFQWALSLSDTPEDEVGWGVTIGGNFGSDRRRVQLESFLKIGLGKRLTLQPGFVYTMDQGTQFPALVLRTCWTL